MAEIKTDDGKYVLHKGVKYRLTPNPNGWYTYSPVDSGFNAFIQKHEMPKAVRDLLDG